MNKKLKKILISSVALVMLAATGTGITSSMNVNASRYYRVHRVRRHARRHLRRHHRIHYSRTDRWYFRNVRHLYNTNRRNRNFRYGYEDADVMQSTLNMRRAYNHKYRQGWITGYLAKNHRSSLRHHSLYKTKQAVSLYYRGMHYGQNMNYRSVTLQWGNQWYENVGRSI